MAYVNKVVVLKGSEKKLFNLLFLIRALDLLINFNISYKAQ